MIETESNLFVSRIYTHAFHLTERPTVSARNKSAENSLSSCTASSSKPPQGLWLAADEQQQ